MANIFFIFCNAKLIPQIPAEYFQGSRELPLLFLSLDRGTLHSPAARFPKVPSTARHIIFPARRAAALMRKTSVERFQHIDPLLSTGRCGEATRLTPAAKQLIRN